MEGAGKFSEKTLVKNFTMRQFLPAFVKRDVLHWSDRACAASSFSGFMHWLRLIFLAVALTGLPLAAMPADPGTNAVAAAGAGHGGGEHHGLPQYAPVLFDFGVIKITKNDKLKKYFDFSGREKGGKPKKEKKKKEKDAEGNVVEQKKE